MKIFEKSLKDYWHTSSKFFIAMLVLAIAQVMIAEFVTIPENLIMPVSLLISAIALVIVFLAGFFAVRKHKFNLKQAAFVGILAFLITIWLVPLSIPAFDTTQFTLDKLIFIYVINTAILSAINIAIVAPVAAFGGGIAKKIK